MAQGAFRNRVRANTRTDGFPSVRLITDQDDREPPQVSLCSDLYSTRGELTVAAPCHRIERQIDLGRTELRRHLDTDVSPAARERATNGTADGLVAPTPLSASRRSSSDRLFLFPRERTSTIRDDEDGDEQAAADPPTPAQRRQAILDHLGLRGVGARGSSGDQLMGAGTDRLGSGEGERWTDGGESDWTDGGDGASSATGATSSHTGTEGVLKPLRRRVRRASMSDFGGAGRPRRDTLSSEDEPLGG